MHISYFLFIVCLHVELCLQILVSSNKKEVVGAILFQNMHVKQHPRGKCFRCIYSMAYLKHEAQWSSALVPTKMCPMQLTAVKLAISHSVKYMHLKSV